MKQTSSSETSSLQGQPMNRIFATLTLFFVILGANGCSLCCSPGDYDYPAYGGKHARVNPAYGRVGSIFSDPNAAGGRQIASSNPGSVNQGSENRDGEFENNLNLETIEPSTRPAVPGSKEALPAPGANDADPTAFRLMNPQPLRGGQSWR